MFDQKRVGTAFGPVLSFGVVWADVNNMQHAKDRYLVYLSFLSRRRFLFPKPKQLSNQLLQYIYIYLFIVTMTVSDPVRLQY